MEGILYGTDGIMRLNAEIRVYLRANGTGEWKKNSLVWKYYAYAYFSLIFNNLLFELIL